MLQITKGQANTLILTLTEKVSISNPKYLFVMKNDHTHVEYPFIAHDLSAFPERYNQFTITETSSTPDTLNDEVELPLTGSYYYEVYEQASTTNLDKDLAGSLLEQGKVLVLGSVTADVKYDDQDKTYSIYNP